MNIYFFLAITVASFWAFVAIASWADARRREREAFYRHETLRRFAETGKTDLIERFLADEKATREEVRVNQREGMKLGGLICLVAGVAIAIFLSQIQPGKPVYLIGLMPGFVGIALLIYSYLLAPEPPQDRLR